MNEEKTRMEQNLEEIFNLEEAAPIAEIIKREHGIDVMSSNTDLTPYEQQYEIEGDMKYAKSNIRALIDETGPVVRTLSSLARQSESPRMFEVLSTLISTLVNANKELISIQKKGNEIRQMGRKGNRTKNDTHREVPLNQYNTLYVGSTAELQKVIQKEGANNIIEANN